MTITEPLCTPEDYERALKEIEQYFENVPEPGTEAADRFERLTALIVEYEGRASSHLHRKGGCDGRGQ